MFEKFLGFKWNFGLLEMLFALYMILSAYSYSGIFRLSLFMVVIMDIIAISRGGKFFYFKPLLWLFVFLMLHEFILFFTLDSFGSAFVNNYIDKFISVFSIFIIAPNLNYRKLVNSLMFVGMISMIGIVYHVVLLQTGGEISTIKLPFMPTPEEDMSRVASLLNRPVSFYVEPAAFVAYMMIPLFLSLYEKKFILCAVIIFSMLLSTSTTGIAVSFAMIVFYVLTQRVKFGYKILLVVAGIGFAYFLVTSELFEKGVSKVENTDMATSQRLANGPVLAGQLDYEQLAFGVNDIDIISFAKSNPRITYLVTFTRSEGLFVPTFWTMLIKLGVVGLFLFLCLLYRSVKYSKELLPLILTLLVLSFSQGAFFNAIFLYQWVFVMAFVYHKTQEVK